MNMLIQSPDLKNKQIKSKETKLPSENVVNAIKKTKKIRLKAMSLEEVQSKYPNRYNQYLNITEPENINEDNLKNMDK